VVILGLKNWLIKKYVGVELKQAKKEAEKGDNIGDDGRKQSAEVRRLRAKAREWEEKTAVLEAKKHYYEIKEELEDYEEDDDGEDEQTPDSPDNLFNKFLSTMLIGQSHAPPSSTQQPSQALPEKVGESLTDDQIKTYLSSIPKNTLKVLQSYDDASLKVLIPRYMPNVSDEEMNKIITIARQM